MTRTYPNRSQDEQPNHVEPNENTALLTNESNTDIYSRSSEEEHQLLDPDDPAVTPLNLQSIRALRFFLYSLLTFTYILTIIFFINTFVSIPHVMELRTSGFLELDFCLLSFVGLLIALIFFEVPSDIERILGFIVAGIFTLLFILMWSIPQTRHMYSVPGIFITGWTTVCLLLALVITPIVVKWGKDHEEIRLTGRRENRRTMREWFQISMSFILLSIFVVIPGILFFLGFMLDVYDTTRLLYKTGAATVGTFVPVTTTSSHHEYNVYIECTPTHRRLVPPLPEGQVPAIAVIEADDRVSAQAIYQGWLEEMYNTNKVAKVCIWNRPGRGFSDNAPSPYTLADNAEALTIALNTVLKHERNHEDNGIPFQNNTIALIAHGVGGLYARVFAAQHLSSIQSILLVDTLHEDILRRTIGPIARGFRLWLEGLVSSLAIQRQLSWIVHGRGPSYRYLSGYPISPQNGGLAFNTHSTEIKASLQDQLSSLSGAFQTEIENTNSILSGSNIPLAVVASAQSIRQDGEWSGLQRRLSKITANNIAFEILDGPHEVWVARKAKERLQEIYEQVLRDRRESY